MLQYGFVVKYERIIKTHIKLILFKETKIKICRLCSIVQEQNLRTL
jgi:hypothetical protein